jgi:CRISPR-associated protein Cmr5
MSESTLDQQRAHHAWNAIGQLFQNGEKIKGADDYAREAKKLPMRILSSGLGQALAFIEAKNKKKPLLKKLHLNLTDWVIHQRQMASGQGKSLLESVIHGDVDFFRCATDETLAYLQWLNRFAEAKGLGDDD